MVFKLRRIWERAKRHRVESKGGGVKKKGEKGSIQSPNPRISRKSVARRQLSSGDWVSGDGFPNPQSPPPSTSRNACRCLVTLLASAVRQQINKSGYPFHSGNHNRLGSRNDSVLAR